MSAEHRPTVTIHVDIFPEDSFLLDVDDDVTEYTAQQVAREAWEVIGRWYEQGYQPIVDVTMPNGVTQPVDLEATE